MHEETKNVAEHMREFGLCVLGRAIYDSVYCEITKPFAHALAVVHAAQGAEIILKARIAEQHPLLIFRHLPKSTSVDDRLGVAELMEHGRTYDYADLPELLWASTGYRLSQLSRYQDFGKMRNRIMHFAVPNLELEAETLRFCIEVMEPILDDFWGTSAVPYSEEWGLDMVSEGELQAQLERIGIEIPECTKKVFAEWDA